MFIGVITQKVHIFIRESSGAKPIVYASLRRDPRPTVSPCPRRRWIRRFRRWQARPYQAARASRTHRAISRPVVFLGMILPLRAFGFCISCTETASIALEILHAKSDSSALLHYNRRPMALLYPEGLERWKLFLYKMYRIQMHVKVTSYPKKNILKGAGSSANRRYRWAADRCPISRAASSDQQQASSQCTKLSRSAGLPPGDDTSGAEAPMAAGGTSRRRHAPRGFRLLPGALRNADVPIAIDGMDTRHLEELRSVLNTTLRLGLYERVQVCRGEYWWC
jgi:hypothetical protein